jgi:hypothetical protein
MANDVEFEPIALDDLLNYGNDAIVTVDSDQFELISEDNCMAEGQTEIFSRRNEEVREFQMDQKALQLAIEEIYRRFGQSDDDPTVLLEEIQDIVIALDELKRSLNMDVEISERLMSEHIDSVRRLGQLLPFQGGNEALEPNPPDAY